MGMDRADQCIACEMAASVRRDDAGGAAVDDDDFTHILPGQHGAAMIFDAADQGLCELAAAAHRHAEAVGLEEPHKHKDAEPGGLFIGGYEILAGHAGEMRTYPVMLEIARQHLVAAHLHGTPELPAFATLVQKRE